jgi:hypothetical protein
MYTKGGIERIRKGKRGRKRPVQEGVKGAL